jgi:hypothetical protein
MNSLQVESRIPGGYYLKARKTQASWIAHAPPHVREIWDWLLMNASFEERQAGEKIIKRGQLLTSYEDIREGLHWMVGWRKERYSKWDCEKAMKALTKATMITTQKTTRGLIVTIQNYDYYQNPKNYESHTEDHRKATRKPQTRHTISKECKEGKKSKENPHSSNGGSPSPSLSASTTEQDFFIFWSEYPLRGEPPIRDGKQAAYKAWQSLNKKGELPPLQIILACLRRYKNSSHCKDPQYIKKGVTWLNGKPWQDEEGQASVSRNRSERPQKAIATAPFQQSAIIDAEFPL